MKCHRTCKGTKTSHAPLTVHAFSLDQYILKRAIHAEDSIRQHTSTTPCPPRYHLLDPYNPESTLLNSFLVRKVIHTHTHTHTFTDIKQTAKTCFPHTHSEKLPSYTSKQLGLIQLKDSYTHTLWGNQLLTVSLNNNAKFQVNDKVESRWTFNGDEKGIDRNGVVTEGQSLISYIFMLQLRRLQ